jgi:hypothetical protein
LKNGGGARGKCVREINGWVLMDQSKEHPQWAHIEKPLNINSNINNKKQDCKIGSVCGGILVGGWRVKEGD